MNTWPPIKTATRELPLSQPPAQPVLITRVQVTRDGQCAQTRVNQPRVTLSPDT